MINKKVLIIGFGSIGQRHARLVSKVVGIKNVYIYSSKSIKTYKSTRSIIEAFNYNPDYIIICTPTSDHFKKVKLIEKKLKKKKVLVEKPLFSKDENIIPRKNKFYIGYNMRFNPIIKTLKKITRGKKFLSVNISCGSYLPDWRKNIHYSQSASAKKTTGGGVLLDLSHELDYARWIFGKLKINNVVLKKLSNLKINTEDFANLVGSAFKTKQLQINLNYFSKKKIRKIIINGNDDFIEADLLKNKIIHFKKNKSKKYFFNYFDRDKTYMDEHIAILKNNRDKKDLCSFKEGKELMKLIVKTKEKVKKNSSFSAV